jgi:Spy/CpxP family protein refolding chaperone
MRNKILIYSAMILLMFCVVLPVAAENAGSLINPQMVENAAKDANITPAQMEQIMSFWFSNEKEIVQLRANIEMMSIDLENAVQSNKPNPKTITSIIQKMGDERTKLDIQTAKFAMKVFEVLTPDQLKVFRKIMMKNDISQCPAGSCPTQR